MAILRYCHRCGGLKPHGHKHRAKDRRPSSTARGYDAKHTADRDRLLAKHPTCQHCGTQPATVLHHVDGLGPLGPRGHDPDNHEALCATCHGRHTAQEQPGGWRAVEPFKADILILCGRPGTGKTTIGDRLSLLLELPALRREDFEDDWQGVFSRLARCDRAIVECARLHHGLRTRATRRSIVEVTAPRAVRRQRLRERGESEQWVERLMVDDGIGIGYEQDLVADLTIDAVALSADEAAARIAEWWETGHR